MSKHLTYLDILAACQPGGASVLAMRTELAPAAGPEAGIAPARYKLRDDPAYAFETRYVQNPETGRLEAARTVVVDSKASALNRVENAIAGAMYDGHPLLSLTPHIRVTYADRNPVTCIELPHRAFDAHVRLGKMDGVETVNHPAYIAARNCTAADARALLEMSPISLVLGVWDSTRKDRQVRVRSALVGETIGVLADQSVGGDRIDPRTSARIDPIAPSVQLTGAEMTRLLDTQRESMSPNKVKDIEDDINKAKTGKVSGSSMVVGSIPPRLEGIGFVSCRSILRTNVLSFSALRQLRFGLGPDGDAAARALLACLALAGLARWYAEGDYRANCDLTEKTETTCELDARHGNKIPVAMPDAEDADAMLAEAIKAAVAFGVRWQGQTVEVEGSATVGGNILANTNDKS